MLKSVDISGRTYTIDPTWIDISIPLKFDGPQPNAYGVEPAIAVPCEAGELVGDTRQGGSCNFEQYTLIPHCNGTHTESVGHLTHERISVLGCLQDILIPVLLITIAPAYAAETDESYGMPIEPSDRVITKTRLKEKLIASISKLDPTPSSHAALCIRTLPNDDRKLTRQYDDIIPPYFTTDAMEYVVERGFKHLLVDLPSIDRLYDEGRLSNHRTFWRVDQGSFSPNSNTRRTSTVTEFIYVPNLVADGVYLLNLQIAPFDADASPSRPILFRITEN